MSRAAKTEEVQVKQFPLQPTPGRVVIRYVKKKKSGSVIIKPGEEEELEDGIGEVVAVSERSSQCRVGCKLVYNRHAAVPVNIDGEEFQVLNEDGILAFFVAD